MSTLIRLIKQEYNIQKELLRRLVKRYSKLEKYNDIVLTFNRARQEYYAYRKGDGLGKRQYCGKKQLALIANIQEAKYLSEAIRRIKSNLAAITTFLACYQSPYPIDVVDCLGYAYRNLDNISRCYRGFVPANAWLKQRRAEKAEHIKKYGEYHPESLTQRTVDGTYTRSKSEVSIYNYLLSKGVTFIYEPIMFVGNEWRRPDFLILTADGREIIIEHLGLSGDSDYLADQFNKIESYIQNNWVPNVNLLLTFDDKDGNIDMSAISKMIDAFLGL